MPVLIDLACCVLVLQSAPVAEHLVPIPLDGWGAAVTETTVPLPEGGAAAPGALVELARERELRDDRVVVVEPYMDGQSELDDFGASVDEVILH